MITIDTGVCFGADFWCVQDCILSSFSCVSDFIECLNCGGWKDVMPLYYALWISRMNKHGKYDKTHSED